MNVLVVYCHPSKNSFTYKVKESFIKGLQDAGHAYEISDLYDMEFNPVMSEAEYLRAFLVKRVIEGTVLTLVVFRAADSMSFAVTDLAALIAIFSLEWINFD